MIIRGYSERGMINALFYGMLLSQKSDNLFNKLLKLIKPYPFFKNNVTNINTYIEPSLSEFGTPDILISFKNRGIQEVIFLEAKIKSWNWKKWNPWEGIFNQLESKFVLFNNRADLNKLHTGINNKKIGTNNVVINNIFIPAVKNAKKAYYIALLPRKIDYSEYLSKNIKPFGYLLWKDIKKSMSDIPRLSENFNFNEAYDQEGKLRSQIYVDPLLQ